MSLYYAKLSRRASRVSRCHLSRLARLLEKSRVSQTHLRIAVRAFTERTKQRKPNGLRSSGSVRRWPRFVLVFDTETAVDTAQRLTFGSYRLCEWVEKDRRLVCKREGIFYADDLPETDPEGFECLREYVRTHQAKVGPGFPRRLRFLSRTDFVKKVFWRFAYKSRALVVGFNLRERRSGYA